MTDDPEGPTVPSDTAVTRLHLGLEEGIAAFTEQLDADLADVERAVATGREELAVEVLTEHLARLEQFSAELQRVVAGSVVEREAEAVLAAAERPAATRPRPPLPPPLRRAGLGQGVLVAACVALLAVLAVLGRPGIPEDPLLAAATASEQALVAARQVATGTTVDPTGLTVHSAELRAAVRSLDPQLLADPAVRARVEAMLADQQRALLALAPRLPVATELLAELHAMADALRLRLPLPPLDLDLDDVPTADTPTRPAGDARPVTAGDPPRPDGAAAEATAPPLPDVSLPLPDVLPDERDDVGRPDPDEGSSAGQDPQPPEGSDGPPPPSGDGQTDPPPQQPDPEPEPDPGLDELLDPGRPDPDRVEGTPPELGLGLG